MRKEKERSGQTVGVEGMVMSHPIFQIDGHKVSVDDFRRRGVKDTSRSGSFNVQSEGGFYHRIEVRGRQARVLAKAGIIEKGSRVELRGYHREPRIPEVNVGDIEGKWMSGYLDPRTIIAPDGRKITLPDPDKPSGFGRFARVLGF